MSAVSNKGYWLASYKQLYPPKPVGEGEQALRNAFDVWAETQGNGELTLLDVLSPDEAEAAFYKWKLNLVNRAAPAPQPVPGGAA